MTDLIDTSLRAAFQLLKKIGFKLYDENDYQLPAGFNADFEEQINDAASLIMLEKEISRNMFCIVLKPSMIDDGYYDYEIWVQQDIGCGWVQMPMRWTEINLDWITNLKKSFEGGSLF